MLVSQGARGQPSEGGAILRLDIALVDPWRIAPAWSVLAGALASGADLMQANAVLWLAGAIALADAVWGIVWRCATESGVTQTGEPVRDPRLPFWQPSSPLAALLRWGAGLPAVAIPARGRVLSGMPALLAALGVSAAASLLLGGGAPLLNVFALALCCCAAWQAGSSRHPFLLGALLDVGVPWLLGAEIAELASSHKVLPTIFPTGAAVALAFTVLVWGFRRAQSRPGRSPAIFGIGVGLVIATLVLLRQSWLSAVVATLMLVPAWRIIRRPAAPGAGSDGFESRHDGVWLLTALLTVAVGLR